MYALPEVRRLEAELANLPTTLARSQRQLLDPATEAALARQEAHARRQSVHFLELQWSSQAARAAEAGEGEGDA